MSNTKGRESRNSDAVRTANLILGSKNKPGLKAGDLESLNGYGQDQPQKNDLRSMKSEYDYGSKRKFVDVLGSGSKNQQNGLKGLEGLQNHPGARNMETSSRVSK